MRKGLLFLLPVAATIALAVAATIYMAHREASSLQLTPMTIRYVQPGSVRKETAQENRDSLPQQMPNKPPEDPGTHTFWFSNHTARILHLSLSVIEIRIGGCWTNYAPGMSMPEGPRFRTQNGWTTRLNPHGSAYGFIKATDFPRQGPCRIRFSASEELVGVRRFPAEARSFVAGLVVFHSFVSPFQRGQIYLGRARDVVSEEFFVTASQ
jgi:hypothetical protein